MKATCPHCGASLHESKKRAYQCGTWENSEGTEYRTVPCKMSETRWKDAKHWASVAEEADRQRAVALSQKEQSEAEAKKDREFAQYWHIRLQEETDKLRAEYLQKVKSALGIEEKKVESAAFLMYGYKAHEARLLAIPEIREVAEKGMKK